MSVSHGKSGFIHKLWLLLWKNLIIRKRQYIVTALEIILPTLFAILMAYIRTKLKTDSATIPAQIYPKISEDIIIRSTGRSFGVGYSYYNTTLGYAPKTDRIERFMKKVQEEVISRSYSSDIEIGNITWIGFNNDEEIEAFLSAQGSNYDFNRFSFAVTFSGMEESDSFGPNVDYKIRYVDEFRDTRELMPWLLIGGSTYESSQYEYSGFLGLQLVIEKFLIEEITGESIFPTNISMQKFPYPEHDGFDFKQLYFIMIPQFVCLGFIFIVPSIVRGIVSEKETGIKELMKMTGLPEWMHWLAWLLNSLAVLIISVTLVVILFFVPFSSNGAVMNTSDPTLWWVVLFVYAIWATTYCFLISSLFTRPTLATTVGIVVWLASFYGIGYGYAEPQYLDLSLAAKLFLCLCPNLGLHFALKVLSAFESTDVGAQWKNIVDPVNAVDSLTTLHVIAMLLACSVIYTLLAIYLECVLPKKYGVRKPWYFLFLPETYGFRKSKSNQENLSSLRNKAKESQLQSSFQQDSSNLPLGLEILQLRKEFGKQKVAVNDISVHAYEGQIFCLLGHNGAGKTTTMSMLTGMLAPSGGTALITGMDIRSQMSEVRDNLGLCPQHNLLFDKLTVAEHLNFFGRVKGLTASEASHEIPALIGKLHLVEKTNSLASQLSGGQKRRLSLGCAIIGKSKVLFLDECSTGLDPEVRRTIWDLLLEIRAKRTIVLTTHFLEEADVLGDRIAIMAGGKIQCCGTPMFLKKYYGTGYTLSLTMQNEANPDSVLGLVKHYLKDASLKDIKKEGFTSLSINLPSNDEARSRFPAMLKHLRASEQELGIVDLNLSLTTMDDVFIKVEELQHDIDANANISTIQGSPVQKCPKTSGPIVFLQQFWGLLIKKFLYSFRRWKLTGSQMLIPILLTIAAVLIVNTTFNKTDKTPPLKMRLSDYKDQEVYYKSSDPDLAQSYDSLISGSGKPILLPESQNITRTLLSLGEKDLTHYLQRHIVAAELSQREFNALVSTIPPHASPLSLNLVTNLILSSMKPGASISVTNHPLKSNREALFSENSNVSSGELSPFVFGILVSIGLSLLSASFIVMPIEERRCQGKQLQLMTGVSPIIFWGSSFVWDLFLNLVVTGLVVASLFAFEKYDTFTNHGGGGVVFLILTVYSFGAATFSYIFSLIAQTPAGGFALVEIIHLITGTGFALAVYIMEDDISLVGTSKIIGWIGRLFPTYGVSKSLMIFSKLSAQNSECNSVSENTLNAICTPDFQYYYTNLQRCCENCAELGVECFKAKPYLVWDYDDNQFYFEKKESIPGVGQELIMMTIVALIYFLVLLLVEYGALKRILNRSLQENTETFSANVQDNDVQEEVGRIQGMISSGRTSQDSVVVQNLCKSYGTFSAVSRLTFGVHRGECFGLLGVNGAGKTTSFRMLTGDEIISHGDAFINGTSLQSDRKQFLKMIGYCPQFDGIIGFLTGKEMLQLFARLRGIPPSLTTTEAEKWLERMGLSSSGNVQCQKYSGGMKRRLSAAMAMIGDPPIVFLDEPSSGVDSMSRRQFWKILQSLRDAGQSIILTSHSMEECEALCSRLGIMVNGEMQCLGRVPHLKNKFAQGFSLSLKLYAQRAAGHEASLVNLISSRLHPCVLKDSHQNSMQFHIASQHKWDQLFQSMEEIKAQFSSYIEEYSIQQTTLEEVFLSFARKQYSNERQVSRNWFRQALSCISGNSV